MISLSIFEGLSKYIYFYLRTLKKYFQGISLDISCIIINIICDISANMYHEKNYCCSPI